MPFEPSTRPLDSRVTDDIDDDTNILIKSSDNQGEKEQGTRHIDTADKSKSYGPRST